MISFGLNVAIALFWLLLSSRAGLGTFTVGYLIGFVSIAVFCRVLRSESYVHRTLAFFRFILIFAREVVLSTVEIARRVLFQPLGQIDPDFVELDVSDLSRGEIILLSHCITLTPGTTSVEISEDRSRLTVHAFDASNPEKVRQSIRTGLLDPILAFTRPWKSS